MQVVNRRRFLSTCAAAGAAALAAPSSLLAAATAPRALRFAHLHTGERLDVEYFSDGAYVPGALGAVDHLLRDFRTGDEHVIDRELLDLLFHVRRVTASTRPFEIISGYRSPKTNAALRRRSDGVASGSLHMQGQAVDIRLGDVPLSVLRRTALMIGRGGVGYYPSSNFVHVDTGRIRSW